LKTERLVLCEVLMTKRRQRRWQRTPEEIVRDFRKHAKQGHVIGNDFSALAGAGDKRICRYLRKLKADNGWLDEGFEPWGRWVNILCEWFEHGPEALVRACKQPSGVEYVGMCLSIFPHLPEAEAIAYMARVIPLRFTLTLDNDEFETASGWCRSVVSFLEAHSPCEMDLDTSTRLRKFTHLLIKKGWRKVERMGQSPRYRRSSNVPTPGEFFYFNPGMAMLAHVGDKASVTLIKSLSRTETSTSHDQTIALIEERLAAETHTRGAKRAAK
jgi:hypothetical protein